VEQLEVKGHPRQLIAFSPLLRVTHYSQNVDNFEPFTDSFLTVFAFSLT